MKQKYIATIGALALTVPALAIAQTQQERSPQTQQPGQTQQQHEQQRQQQHERTPGTAQPGAQQQRGEHHGQMGQKRAGVDQQKLQGAFKADNLTGQEITDQQGEEIGQVEDFLIDREGRVVALLVTTGGVMGIGGETKAVEWDRFQVQVDQDGEIDRITTTMSEQELDQLPEYDEDRQQRGATGRN